MKRRDLILVGAALGIAAASGLTGYFLAGQDSTEMAGGAERSGRRVLYWYDPMVPDRHFPQPGKSPFMDMQLIPKYADEAAEAGVTVSPATMQNLGIRLAKVETRDLAPLVRAVGRVEFDERLISEVQTLTPGFVESLSVRAEGEPIGGGRVIATLYSPELLAAQNEYKALLASRGVASASLKQAARSRLRLLGLPEGSVKRLERGGAPQRTYPVVARTSGVVTKIGARPGAQVSPGQSIVTVQGLSRALVIVDVPEASLSNVRVGQPAQISFPAYGDEVRTGSVDYIFPTLNPQSRTAQLRITLPNQGIQLKQGMFANVTLQGAGGMAVAVPSEAVIDTGRRQVVIVKRNGSFIPQEVRIGRDDAEWSQVLAGLKPGEEVVASGQFLIDSEASLSGMISRLSASQAPRPTMARGRGMVVAVDAAKGLVTINHEPVPEVGWPTMTMTFKAPQASMLRGVKKGSRVGFAFQAQPRGSDYVLIRIMPEGTR